MEIKNQSQLREFFWDVMYPRYTPKRFSSSKKFYRQNDYCAEVRMNWVDFVDVMQREGRISDNLAHTATLRA
jgi:hypothetical protein